MLRTLLRDESHQFRVVEDSTVISELVKHNDRLLWLDLEHPTAEEFAIIKEEFCLHPLAVEDAMARHQRPKVDPYDNFYLVVFYSVGIEEPGERSQDARRDTQGSQGAQGMDLAIPAVTGRSASEVLGPRAGRAKKSAQKSEQVSNASIVGSGDEERIVLRELTLFMAQNFLITVHDHHIAELDEAAKRWTRNIETIAEEAAKPQHNLPGTRNLTPTERTSLTPQSKHVPSQHGGRPNTHDANNGKSTPDTGQDSQLGLVPASVMHRDGDDNTKHHSQDIGILLYSLLDTIVDSYFPVIDNIVDRIEALEESIFERYNQRSIESIFTLKKDLLALRKVLAPERDVLNILTRRDIPIFDEHTLVYFQDVYDHVVRVTDSIDTYRDLLSSALDSFLSMQSNRLNITVQTLTSVSIMLMSISTVTGWYGMNFEAMPELRSAWGYPGVIIFIAIVLSIEVFFFKRKGWL